MDFNLLTIILLIKITSTWDDILTNVIFTLEGINLKHLIFFLSRTFLKGSSGQILKHIEFGQLLQLGKKKRKKVLNTIELQ